SAVGSAELGREAAGGSTVEKPILGALWAVLATAGVGAVHGSIVRLKECGATADALTSAIFFAMAYVVIYGLPASALGAFLGWALGRRVTSGPLGRATKPGMWTDDL